MHYDVSSVYLFFVHSLNTKSPGNHNLLSKTKKSLSIKQCTINSSVNVCEIIYKTFQIQQNLILYKTVSPILVGWRYKSQVTSFNNQSWEKEFWEPDTESVSATVIIVEVELFLVMNYFHIVLRSLFLKACVHRLDAKVKVFYVLH